MNLFAYGTLMCEDIFMAVSGTRLTRAAATARDYARLRVKDEDYPALVPREGGHVEGFIYYDVPSAAWDRLDRFEGELYVRQSIRVHLVAGGTSPAEVYVARTEAATDRLLEKEWTLDSFLGAGKERFRRSYLGFEALG